ncbi:plasmid stabilization protein [Gammaproteobacteria bacterium 42_54_T18]|nr:plasmid stabilization protein [Gammaproteobacteria bacterium 42_54_T18]
MAQIVWTEPALNELDEIADFIALDKFNAAQKLVQSVFDRVEQLKDQPKSGRIPPELPKNSIYREVIVGPCSVFYRTEKSKIIIIYVMRSERVLRKFLLEERAGPES